MIGNLDDAKRPLILISPKMSGYLKTFNDKGGDQDKDNNTKLMYFHIDDYKLSEKWRTNWTKNEYL